MTIGEASTIILNLFRDRHEAEPEIIALPGELVTDGARVAEVIRYVEDPYWFPHYGGSPELVAFVQGWHDSDLGLWTDYWRVDEFRLVNQPHAEVL